MEAGETIYQALTREIEEETGWRLVRIIELVETFDWDIEKDGAVIEKREFDFLVEVSGNLEYPQIERDKFSEFRWVGIEELEVLKENRPAEDLAIFNLVQKALKMHKGKRTAP